MSMSQLYTLLVPIAIASLAAIVLVLDVAAAPGEAAPGRRWSGWITLSGLVLAFAATFFGQGAGTAAFGAYAGGPWTTFVQRLVLAAAILGVLGAIDDVSERTPGRQGEYWLLMLSSVLGMVILPGARDLILVVVAFELMGIPLYVLCAYAKNDARGDEPARSLAAEAAFKLYVVGAASTAVTLFGLALLTGMTGSSRVESLASAPHTPLTTLGMLLVLGGMAYKIGMAPFHMWVPDTYQGASTPFVAFLSVAPKVAGVSVLAVVFLRGFGADQTAWLPALALGALLSMVVGNLLAIAQTDVRRLLAYSGIAQIGYVLLAVAAGGAFGVSMTLFFLTAYVVSNLGAFLVVHAAGAHGRGYTLGGLRGMSRSSPGLAAALLAFLLSLAGIPFAVGFWAKLYVFLAAWRSGLAGLVVAGVILAALGLFYYLSVLQAAYISEPEQGRGHVVPRSSFALRAGIAVCALAVLALGLWPAPVVEAASRAGADLLATGP
jgi:NADH-quinone oxidoreductase subunit N